MNRYTHGLVSLGLLGVAAALGVIAIARFSVLLAILYLCVIALSVFVVLYSFCCKCMCRATTCGHVLPGALTAYLPRRMSGRFSATDKAGVIVPTAVALLYPQYWLLQDPPLFSLFWILVILSGMEIRTWVCRGCTNRYCPMSPVPPPTKSDELARQKS